MKTLVMLALAGSSLACAETNMRAIERLRSPYQQERSLLARIVAALPPPGSARESLPQGLDPPLVLIEGYAPASLDAANTEVLSVQTATTPDEASYGRATFEPRLGRNLEHCLAWTGPNNPLDPAVHGDRGTLGADCERALAARYLLLTRVVEESLPERLAFEGFIVQHRLERVVGTVAVDLRRATPTRQGEAAPVLDPATLRSEFHEAARCALLGRLARIDGATIRSNARCPVGSLTTEVGPLQRAAP